MHQTEATKQLTKTYLDCTPTSSPAPVKGVNRGCETKMAPRGTRKTQRRHGCSVSPYPSVTQAAMFLVCFRNDLKSQKWVEIWFLTSYRFHWSISSHINQTGTDGNSVKEKENKTTHKQPKIHSQTHLSSRVFSHPGCRMATYIASELSHCKAWSRASMSQALEIQRCKYQRRCKSKISRNQKSEVEFSFHQKNRGKV